MTKTERRKIVGVLKEALARLPDTVYDQGSPFICDSVYFATDDECLCQRIHGIIRQRIGRNFSIEQWLRAQSIEIAEQVRDDVFNNKGRGLQAYRKAWVRELIKEFEA